MTSNRAFRSSVRIGERYELLRRLARGGMGEVWVAKHVELDRLVAIKLLVADGGQDSAALSEARMLARLRHPNVVDVFDCGTDSSGVSYIVMELLGGQTLAAYLDAHGPLGAVSATQLLLPVLNGLSAVHSAGLVHRDLKPENIVLSGDDSALQAKLIDFGIARAPHSEASTTTASGFVVGTPQYMSPEQIQGAPGDIRSDVWGATAVLYEAIADRPAFEGGDVEQIFRAVANDPPAFPAHVKDLDGRLWSILTRGLRKLPSERFETCEALASALRAWLTRPGNSRPSPSAIAVSPSASPSLSKSVGGRGGVVQLPTEAIEAPLDLLMRRKPPER